MSEQKRTMVCPPPQVPTCVVTGPPWPGMPGANMVCTCVASVPLPLPTSASCTVSIVYPSDNPGAVYLAAKNSYCDGTGVEIALAVLLAKLLTGPPLP